jgi:hypothetical protein
MNESSCIVKVTRTGTELPISLNVSRIVAISDITTIEEENPRYYIYFENAIWSVKADSYDDVYTKWVNFIIAVW